MGDGHLALHPERGHPLEDQVHREPADVAALVEVDVGADLMPLAHGEHLVEVLHRIPVVQTGVEPAHHVGAIGQSGVDQVEHAGVVQQSDLGEGDQLDVHQVPAIAGGPPAAPRSAPAAAGVDLGVRADGRRRRWRSSGQRVHRLVGDAPLVVNAAVQVVLDQRCQRALRGVRAETLTEAVGVEVAVHVGQRREEHPAAAVDLDVTLGRRHAGRR